MGRIPSYDPMAPKGPWMSALSWSARQRPVTWFLVNIGNKVDPYLMRATGGRARTTLNAPTVLLTHTGAKSGKKRTTPLAYFTDGDNVVLIASRGGHHDHPAWYHNVVANPEVELWTNEAAAATGRGKPRASSASDSGASQPASTLVSRSTRSGQATGGSRSFSASRRTTNRALALRHPEGWQSG